MPTYEYRCESCGQTFDYRQSMSDPRLEKCILNGCEGSVKRLLGTGAGIIFKGTGFYETDYRSESYKKGAESANKSTSDSKSDSGSSDSSSSGDSSKKTTKTPESKPASSPSTASSTSSSTAKPSSD